MTNKVRAALSADFSPPPLTETPSAPTWLDAIARAEWERVAELLVSMRRLTAFDLALLESYCHAYSAWRTAVEVYQKEGTTTIDNKGNVRAHPAVRISNEKATEMRRLADAFGFNPAGRGRIKGGSPSGDGEDNELEKFLGG